MALLRKISLTNFKGAASITIDLGKKIDCPVSTLIGLNESGKTTILEGLSHFLSGDTDVSSLFDVPTKTVPTLGSVSEKFKGFQLESLICAETKEKIKFRLGSTEQPTKKQIGLYLSECFATDMGSDSLGTQSREDLLLVLNFVNGLLVPSTDAE